MSATEGFVVRESSELGLGHFDRVRTTDRTGRITPYLQLGESRTESFVKQQAADQRLTDAEHQLDHFIGLEQAHDAGHDTQHAVSRATGCQFRRRGARIQAAIAGALMRHEGRDLPVEGIEADTPGLFNRTLASLSRYRVGKLSAPSTMMS